MNLALSARIGFRYWRAKKSNSFASFITFFAVSGILLGVAALILVSSVMNGLEQQLKDRILGAVPQLTLHNSSSLNNWPQEVQRLSRMDGVKSVSPSLAIPVMLQSSQTIAAAQLYGIYPEHEPLLKTQVATFSGGFEQLQFGKYRVVLGVQLARKLKLRIGDRVRIISSQGVIYSPLGPVPSQRKFTVAGVFEMGSQVDESVAYIHYEDAQRLSRTEVGEVKELRLYLDDPFDATQVGEQLKESLISTYPDLIVTDWRESYGHLFSAVKMEKNMMSLMLSLIIAVAAFNIVSALVMMVVDKTTDVAVLKTQGIDTATIMGIFMIQGSLNAVIGLIAGLTIGVGLTLHIDQLLTQLGLSILGPGQVLPVALQWEQLVAIVLGTLMITLLATVYPALRAARVEPATALRYE